MRQSCAGDMSWRGIRMPPEQSFATHRRFHPVFHFFVVPVLVINVFVAIYWFVKYTRWQFAWGIVLSAAFLALAVLTRFYSLRQQDRIIRLEERLRLREVLPDDLRPRINELRTSQLIALRFCSDEELPEATRAVLAGEVKSA